MVNNCCIIKFKSHQFILTLYLNSDSFKYKWKNTYSNNFYGVYIYVQKSRKIFYFVLIKNLSIYVYYNKKTRLIFSNYLPNIK